MPSPSGSQEMRTPCSRDSPTSSMPPMRYMGQLQHSHSSSSSSSNSPQLPLCFLFRRRRGITLGACTAAVSLPSRSLVASGFPTELGTRETASFVCLVSFPRAHENGLYHPGGVFPPFHTVTENRLADPGRSQS